MEGDKSPKGLRGAMEHISVYPSACIFPHLSRELLPSSLSSRTLGGDEDSSRLDYGKLK